MLHTVWSFLLSLLSYPFKIFNRRDKESKASAPHLRIGQIILGLFIVILIVSVSIALYRNHKARNSQFINESKQNKSTISVGVISVEKSDITDTIDALGTVTPLSTVTVKTQISGQLTEIAFTEGQMVSKGDFLAQIDPRPYQAALAQSEGQLEKDQALLKSAKIDLERYRFLVEEDSIAKQTFDTQNSLVEQYQGIVATDKALVDNAKLNLSYCHILSPIDGRVGLRQVDSGNYVQSSDSNGIVVITKIHPISILFSTAEDNLFRIIEATKKHKELSVTAYDRSGTVKLATGKLSTLDNQIDTSTGTVKMRALFDNSDDRLFPNQFVTIKLSLDVHQNSMILPNSAILHGQNGPYVYRIKDEKYVTIQPIKTGIENNNFVEILEGLDLGHKIIIDGIDKLKEGSKIVIVNDMSHPPMPITLENSEDKKMNSTKKKGQSQSNNTAQ